MSIGYPEVTRGRVLCKWRCLTLFGCFEILSLFYGILFLFPIIVLEYYFFLD